MDRLDAASPEEWPRLVPSWVTCELRPEETTAALRSDAVGGLDVFGRRSGTVDSLGHLDPEVQRSC